MPDESFILGVDEHTAVLLDLDARTATVAGNGTMTIRKAGRSGVYPSGSVVGYDDLAAGGPATLAPATLAPSALAPSALAPGALAPAAGADGGAAAGVSAAIGTPDARSSGAAAGSARVGTGGDPSSAVPAESTGSLRADVDRLDERFAAALATRDIDGCVAAILDVEAVLTAWAADTLTSDEGDHARAVLRRMVVRLGELAATGVTGLAPLVEALLDMRRRAREARDFAASDRIRDQLASAGIEVRDTPAGMAWNLR